MSETPDPLWDPALPGDEALQRLTSLLGAYRYAPPPTMRGRYGRHVFPAGVGVG